jgi:hypothetical protein
MKQARPSIVGTVGPGTTWFDVTAFANPIPAGATPRYGTAGRNSLRGPGYFNYDFSIFKGFQIREDMRLEFRTEPYNLTNTPKFEQPNGDFSQASFGVVNTTFNNAGEREVQFALRFLF